MSAPSADLFTTALEHHQYGRLGEAEQLYRTILASDPDHLGSLNYLGAIAYQRGQPEQALELIGRALAINDRIPDCHNGMGEALRALGRLDAALEHFDRAIALDPQFAEAHSNRASTLAAQGRLDEAVQGYRQAIALQPRLLAAHENLGHALRRTGRLEEAAAAYREAVALAPERHDLRLQLGAVRRVQGRHDEAAAAFAEAARRAPRNIEAQLQLAYALQESGRLADAASAFRHALALHPAHPDALYGLAVTLLSQGDAGQAMRVAHHALTLAETAATRALFAHVLKTLRDPPAIDGLDRLLVRALHESWDRPAQLARVAMNLLKRDPELGPLIARAAAAWPRRPSLDAADRAMAFKNELLRAVLVTSPAWDADVERLLTAMRAALLAQAREAAAPADAEPDALAFWAALARQCFINGYVFAQGAEEAEHVQSLEGKLADAIARGGAIAAIDLLACAAYRPLHSIPGAETLPGRAWPSAIGEVLRQQIVEPRAEIDDRSAIPHLTPIEDRVSRLVREQYEESPYPVWVAPAPTTPMEIDAYLRNQLPMAPFRPLNKADDLEILIAGCGTGQHAVETARRFPRARILAIDLSLASLGYARRQARAAGLANVEFAQADILELGALDRRFDVIEAVGVLHHMAEPKRGLAILHGLLRDHGLLRLGLYSAVARSEVAAARTLIAERGFRPQLDDIRRCRQELLLLPPRAPGRLVTESAEFFSAGACRDLLFHVQEHRLTLPRIKNWLAELRLTFLGFEHDAFVLERYRRRFPNDRSMTDLDAWHAFEAENPRTFGVMYQFWTQKG